jgi:hypothetical protein
VVLWYIFHVLVCCSKTNLATLTDRSSKTRRISLISWHSVSNCTLWARTYFQNECVGQAFNGNERFSFDRKKLRSFSQICGFDFWCPRATLPHNWASSLEHVPSLPFLFLYLVLFVLFCSYFFCSFLSLHISCSFCSYFLFFFVLISCSFLFSLCSFLSLFLALFCSLLVLFSPYFLLFLFFLRLFLVRFRLFCSSFCSFFFYLSFSFIFFVCIGVCASVGHPHFVVCLCFCSLGLCLNQTSPFLPRRPEGQKWSVSRLMNW